MISAQVITQEMLDHQQKMAAARIEFSKTWNAEKAEHARRFGPRMLWAEALAWEYFKLGKGIKSIS